jgi:hypothetical protein
MMLILVISALEALFFMYDASIHSSGTKPNIRDARRDEDGG